MKTVKAVGGTLLIWVAIALAILVVCRTRQAAMAPHAGAGGQIPVGPHFKTGPSIEDAVRKLGQAPEEVYEE
jgi:hypothetical protein